MRRPLLMTAALGVAAIPIGLIALQDSRPRPVQQSLKTYDVEAPPADGAAPASPRSVPMPPAPPSPPPSPDAPTVAASLRDAEPPIAASGPGGVLPEVAPRVAYSYAYRFRVPAAALASVQERHLQLCRSLGEWRCRVVSMRRSETQPRVQPPRDYGYGGGQPVPEPPGASLEVQVAAQLADEFGSRLTATTGAAGGGIVDRQIGAEDVSREMVDSEARIRTRETLIRRLSALLETRSGNIEQAVQAERAINEAQQELESARAWLAETRGRVAMSRISIEYEASGAVSAPSSASPIATAFDRLGSLTAHSLAAVLLVAGLAIPWGLVGALIWYAARWHRRRTEAREPVVET